MKLASFNLNGIRARLPRFLEWLERDKPDIVCLQELKCADESLPIADIEAAVEAGVSAYVVDGLRKERVKPILDMAISRFNAFARLTRELEEARGALEDRKLIDQAKAILIKSRGLSEADAYALLRKTAMNQNRKIADIAQSLITAAGLLDS